MTRTMFCWLCALSLVVCTGAAVYAQGAYWESNLSGGPFGDQPVLNKTYYMPGMARTEQGSGEITIIRMDQEKIYSINPETKEYSEMTFADLEKAAGKANAKMDELKKKLADMPPEQRKMMEQMMGDKLGKGAEQQASVEATGETSTISGWKCSKYVVKAGPMEFTVWATKDVAQPGSMRKDWEQMNRRMSSMRPGGSGTSLSDAMQKIDGFPVETDMTQGIKNVVIKYEKRSTPASQFEVPSGYTKTENKLNTLNK